MDIKGLFKKITRREFIKRSLFYGGIFGIFGYGFVLEPHNVKFERKSLEAPNLPDGWVGRKMIQVTDIHCSDYVKEGYLKKVYKKINAEKPDIIVFTGDYVYKKPIHTKTLEKTGKILKTSMGDKGKIAVMGNHDRWTDDVKVTKALKGAGFRILLNDSVELGDGETLKIIGAEDLWTGHVDFEKMLGGIDLEKDAAILLSHNPDIFPEAAKRKVPVMISGHTHGGQVVIPFIGAPILPSKFDFCSGFYRIGKSVMYINRGLGMVTPPVRFLCPPEVTVFTLVKG